MDIKKQIRNDLFKREEVSFLVDAPKNPTFNEMKKLVSEKFKKAEENVDVYNIYGRFGTGRFLVKAYVYDTRADLDKSVRKSRKQYREEKKVLADKKKADAEAKKKAAEENLAK